MEKSNESRRCSISKQRRALFFQGSVPPFKEVIFKKDVISGRACAGANRFSDRMDHATGFRGVPRNVMDVESEATQHKLILSVGKQG